MFCFDSLQASYLLEQIELKTLFEQKTVYLEAITASQNKELDARELAYYAQASQLSHTQDALGRQAAQISLLTQTIAQYKKSDRKAKIGKFAYKTATFALACLTVYLAVK